MKVCYEGIQMMARLVSQAGDMLFFLRGIGERPGDGVQRRCRGEGDRE